MKHVRTGNPVIGKSPAWNRDEALAHGGILIARKPEDSVPDFDEINRLHAEYFSECVSIPAENSKGTLTSDNDTCISCNQFWGLGHDLARIAADALRTLQDAGNMLMKTPAWQALTDQVNSSAPNAVELFHALEAVIPVIHDAGNNERERQAVSLLCRVHELAGLVSNTLYVSCIVERAIGIGRLHERFRRSVHDGATMHGHRIEGLDRSPYPREFRERWGKKALQAYNDELRKTGSKRLAGEARNAILYTQEFNDDLKPLGLDLPTPQTLENWAKQKW